ncbi:MAG: sterol carrier protein domain-containing protein [Dehalococcoidia bacterium]|nr:sterol carrier protein domain-containing protein [Dehalococcoidia bacterium]MDP7213600.1 sterol carrier protein domain-containing protein [Dehalococcoidia bacterium]MDP7515233.1 sterol carrier protein domain-containing protein [Dehalococcoidia bacterium]
MWLRLIDVPTALSARKDSEEGSLVFHVEDSICTWNNGNRRIDGSTEGAEQP